MERAGAGHKAKLKELEKRVKEQGFTLVQVQMGPFVQSRLVPVIDDKPVDMDELDSLVEAGKISTQGIEELKRKRTELQDELEELRFRYGGSCA